MHMMASVATPPKIASKLGICHGACKHERLKLTQDTQDMHHINPTASSSSDTRSDEGSLPGCVVLRAH